jgi:ASC-1-like (ASCH) protein
MKINCEMRLNDAPFDKTKSGEKVVEGRLFDEKRRLLKVGDVIRFYRRFGRNEFVDVRVVGLLRYDSFSDMFLDLGAEIFGCVPGYAVENLVRAYRKYYSEEEDKRLGALGIKFELVS